MQKNVSILICLALIPISFYVLGGSVQESPALSCLHILNSKSNTVVKSGFYWITIDNMSVEVYCDMVTDGGKLLRFLLLFLIKQ